MRELDELRGCTFRPCLVKKLSSSPTTPRQPGSSPHGLASSLMDDAASSVGGYSVEYATTKLRNLVEAQQQAYAKLQALAHEEGPLKERLRVLHSELHERIQREETSRVVSMLQDADSGSASQKDLVQRVRDMVAEGQDPESAQQMIVEELVMQSQDEVRRRVVENFGPMRLEVEGELYSRQLAVAHELEALEAKPFLYVVALFAKRQNLWVSTSTWPLRCVRTCAAPPASVAPPLWGVAAVPIHLG